MVKTTAGLPNTCSKCGKKPGEAWFAPHEDAARSGQGLCTECATPTATPTADSGDDLTQISGIGKKTAVALAEAGLITFRLLAEAEPENVAQIVSKNVDTVLEWQAQAAELA